MPTYDHHGNRLDDLAYHSQKSESDFWWAWRQEQEQDPAFVRLVETGLLHLRQMSAAAYPFDIPRLVRFLSHQLKQGESDVHKLELAAHMAWEQFNPPTHPRSKSND